MDCGGLVERFFFVRWWLRLPNHKKVIKKKGIWIYQFFLETFCKDHLYLIQIILLDCAKKSLKLALVPTHPSIPLSKSTFYFCTPMHWSIHPQEIKLLLTNHNLLVCINTPWKQTSERLKFIKTISKCLHNMLFKLKLKWNCQWLKNFCFCSIETRLLQLVSQERMKCIFFQKSTQWVLWLF